MINSSKKLQGPFLIDLRNKFREIAGEDQLIDRKEFQLGLEIENDDIINRLFDLFDTDKNGTIDFNEFMEAIQKIIDGTDKDKIEFAFNLYDLDNNGIIDRLELKVLIEQSFIENNLDYDEFQLELLVDEFFKRADLDKSGTIDFKEFLNIADNYPKFLTGFSVNPISWLNPDRYNDSVNDGKKKKQNLSGRNIQVQDVGILQWLLIPRLIFLYNILLNRRKNREFVNFKNAKLLPSRILELTITTLNNFKFKPGDYVYINCPEISRIEWYPFNIINQNNTNEITLNIKSDNKWTKKLYQNVFKQIEKDKKLDWNIRIDGPYGSSSNNILNSRQAILVGAGHGISKMAPILQDIALKSQNNSEPINLKRLDLFWLNSDDHYFEWFMKMLNDIRFPNTDQFFNYHIYFLDRAPEDLKEKIVYISKDVINNSTTIDLIDDLWHKSSFGKPDWKIEFERIKKRVSDFQPNIFYSGPRNLKSSLKKECKKQGFSFQQGKF